MRQSRGRGTPAGWWCYLEWHALRDAGHSRPATAGGIQFVDSAFPKVCGVDSRFRGNDCDMHRPRLANDTSTAGGRRARGSKASRETSLRSL
jgi:hypothetical protein